MVSTKSISFLTATVMFVFCLKRLERSDAFPTPATVRRSGIPLHGIGTLIQSSRSKVRLFSYLDSLSGKGNVQNDDSNSQQTKNDPNGHSTAAWGGTSNGGEEYQDQYGRTIASSPSSPTTGQQAEDVPSNGSALQYDPMSTASTKKAAASPSPHKKNGTRSQLGSRISSIPSLQDVAVTNNPYSTVGKDSPQEGRRLRQQPKNDAQKVTHYRRSPNFDFAKESDKYLKFSSQRIGHDRLEPMDRSTQTQYPSNRRRPTESVMEERKPNTMFHSNNQAAMMNARAVAEKPNIDLDHLNDVLSNPSPFRFLGQVDPNVDTMKPSIQAMRDREVATEERERSFFGSQAQYRQVRPDGGL